MNWFRRCAAAIGRLYSKARSHFRWIGVRRLERDRTEAKKTVLSSEDKQVLARIRQLLSDASATERDDLRRSVAEELAKLAFYGPRARDLVRKGSATGPTRPFSLAGFTIHYAERFTPADAIAALEDWITVEALDTHAYAYVENVTTDVAIVVADGVTIIPASTAPKEMKKAIANLAGPYDHVGALIEIVWTGSPFIKSKSKNRAEDHLLDAYDPPPWLELIEKARKIIAVATRANPVIRLTGAFDWGPELRLLEGTGGGSFPYPELAPQPRPRPIPTEKIRTLWQQYSKLPDSDRRRVDVAIDRLSLATVRKSPADALVETAISLEALLSDRKNKDELAYRLRLRAALFLGTTLASRIEIRSLVRDLYTERSSIVHGNLPDKQDAGLRLRATVLAQRLIIRILAHGRVPDWQELELNPPALAPINDTGSENGETQ